MLAAAVQPTGALTWRGAHHNHHNHHHHTHNHTHNHHPRRTFDPEEADFFYVPIYSSCYAHPVHGYLDGPWWCAAAAGAAAHRRRAQPPHPNARTLHQHHSQRPALCSSPLLLAPTPPPFPARAGTAPRACA
jgi:hypothetical protein